jgi:hypothetical protein
MSDTVRLRDADGNVHYTARGSQKAEELLRDGATDLDPLPEPQEEVTDATEPPAQGDDPDTGTTGGGSGDGERTPRNTKRRDRGAGEA